MRSLRLIVLVLLLGLVGVPAATAALAGCTGRAANLGEPGGDVQSWLVTMHLNGHVFHVGDTVTGTAVIEPIGDCGPHHRCVRGLLWDGAPSGLKQAGRCGAKDRVCTFKAVAQTDSWQRLSVGITNDVGPAFSADYYRVVDRTARVISGTVTHPATGKGIPGVQIEIAGPRCYRAQTGPSGFYSALAKAGTYTVSYTPPSRYESFSRNRVTVRLGERARADFVLKERHRSSFAGVPEAGGSARAAVKLLAGSDHHAQYVGEDWDELGSQIRVTAAGTLSPAPGTRDATNGRWASPVSLEAYPTGTCRVPVTAEQDGTKRTITFWARRVARVLYAGGSPNDTGVANGRRTPTGSYVCEGERAENNGSSVAVYLAVVRDTFEHLVHDGAGFNGIRVVDQPGNVYVGGGLYTPSITVPTPAGPRTVGGNGGGNVTAFDTAGRQNLQQLPATLATNSTVGGAARVEGDFHAQGQLSLDGAVLYVHGNVTIDGGLIGHGALIATGSVTVRGATRLESDGMTSIRCGGPLRFG